MATVLPATLTTVTDTFVSAAGGDDVRAASPGEKVGTRTADDGGTLAEARRLRRSRGLRSCRRENGERGKHGDGYQDPVHLPT